MTIREGQVGYASPILTDIHLSLSYGERIAIEGPNGSGKSTLIKGLLQHPSVTCNGEWELLATTKIGYLDQHYSTLDTFETALDVIEKTAPNWSQAECRKHLNTFLFRKNEEILLPIQYLSGGEKARLSLAHIAALSPRLLILDEMTNNIDLETRQHVISVLNAYPGALMVISHDAHFLDEIQIDRWYQVDSQSKSIR